MLSSYSRTRARNIFHSTSRASWSTQFVRCSHKDTRSQGRRAVTRTSRRSRNAAGNKLDERYRRSRGGAAAQPQALDALQGVAFRLRDVQVNEARGEHAHGPVYPVGETVIIGRAHV